MNVAVLVPRRSDGGRRDEVWVWLRERWNREHPDYTVIEGNHDDGAFNRSAAINLAAGGDWDVAVIADSDSFVEPRNLIRAVNTAADSRQITFAYHEFRYLTRKMTEKIMGGYRGNWYAGVEFTLTNTCSSMVVVPRSLWDDVGGFDEGFVGWGFEDVAFSLACQALGGGMQRIQGDVWHLFHQPSTENNHASPQWHANRARMLRYGDCDYDPAKVRALLEELA